MKNVNCMKCNRIISSQDVYGLHPHCFNEWFDADPADVFENVARKEGSSTGDPSLQNLEYWNSSFFHGKFLKYAADLAGKSYIIKLQEEQALQLPFVEYTCNQIAHNLGMKVPPYYLVMFYGKPAFVTQNLLGKRADIKQLVHIYHYVEKPENYNCETLVSIVHAQTQNMKDIDSFIDICLYDGLIGNHDRHGRNLGLIIDAHRKTLCPAYDNTSVLGLESGEILKANFSPRGKIATKNENEPTMKDYVQDFLRLGYREVVISFYNRIKINEIESIIEMSLCSSLMKEAFLKLIKSRYAEITDALRN